MKMQQVSPVGRFSIKPIFWRRIHKWVGLVLGLQFVLWTFSGAVMALLDSDAVGGHSAPVEQASDAPWPSAMVSAAALGPVERLTVRRVLDRPVYEIEQAGVTKLFDAVSGKPMAISADMAGEIARRAFHADGPVRSISRLDRANLEARDHEGPMWRVDFADTENSSSYVSATTGRALVHRGDTWRTWDFVWMLHNMDYVNRTSFNHPLIIFVAFGALWLSFTGFYLLFKSFRRREFNWLLGRERKARR